MGHPKVLAVRLKRMFWNGDFDADEYDCNGVRSAYMPRGYMGFPQIFLHLMGSYVNRTHAYVAMDVDKKKVGLFGQHSDFLHSSVVPTGGKHVYRWLCVL